MKKFLPKARKLKVEYRHTARWSSLVARWAHNPKVVSSNLARATKSKSSGSTCWAGTKSQLSSWLFAFLSRSCRHLAGVNVAVGSHLRRAGPDNLARGLVLSCFFALTNKETSSWRLPPRQKKAGQDRARSRLVVPRPKAALMHLRPTKPNETLRSRQSLGHEQRKALHLTSSDSSSRNIGLHAYITTFASSWAV